MFPCYFLLGGKREGTYVHLWLIHGDIWQKSNQDCKAIILQLRINRLKTKTKTAFRLVPTFTFSQVPRQVSSRWTVGPISSGHGPPGLGELLPDPSAETCPLCRDQLTSVLCFQDACHCQVPVLGVQYFLAGTPVATELPVYHHARKIFCIRASIPYFGSALEGFACTPAGLPESKCFFHKRRF